LFFFLLLIKFGCGKGRTNLAFDFYYRYVFHCDKLRKHQRDRLMYWNLYVYLTTQQWW